MMQAVFGLVAPGHIAANMVASGVTGSIASESEGLMQDFKTGDMIGSTPRYLTYDAALAVPVGAIAVSYVYPLLRATYGIGGDRGLQSPISQKWAGFAQLLSKGVGGLPPGALAAMAVAMVLGAILTLLESTRHATTCAVADRHRHRHARAASAVITMFLGSVGRRFLGENQQEVGRSLHGPAIESTPFARSTPAASTRAGSATPRAS